MRITWLEAFAPLRPDALARPKARSLPYPMEDPRCRLYRWGRQALWHGLGTLPLEPGDEVLAPAYHHGSEIEAIYRAGLRCRFYEAHASLEPDEAELEGLLTDRSRALYLTHYLGFALDAPRWRRWCDERGLLLLEDAAMAWPASRDGRPLGSFGDLAIFSPWKTFGLPDAGALMCDRPPPQIRLKRRSAARTVAAGHRDWLAQHSPALAARRWRGVVETAYDPEADFALGDPQAPPSAVSRFLLLRLASIDAAAARRRNHARMLEAVGSRVPSPFDVPSPGSCPFVLPMRVEEKTAAIGHLARFGIRALDVWSVPHKALPASGFPGAADRRATTVGLPVHQELAPASVERIIEAALSLGGAPAR